MDESSVVTSISGAEGRRHKGYVYIVQSECIVVKDQKGKTWCPVKIGKALDIKNRLGNLNSAVPIDFAVHLLIECDDCYGLESEIHNKLGIYQYGKTEFFCIDVKDVKSQVRQIAIEYSKENRLSKPRFEKKFAQLGRSASSIRTNQDKLYGGLIRFECDIPGGGKAFGKFSDDPSKVRNGLGKFVVLAGSQIRRIPADSFETAKPLSYYKKWKSLLEKGEFVNSDGILLKDIVFQSRAMATSVVFASTRNGDKEWKYKKSETIGGKSVERFICLGEFFGRIRKK